MASARAAACGLETPLRSASTAKTFRSSRRISPSMCCRPMSCASIPRTGSSFFTASFIARSPPRSERAEKAFGELVRELEQDFPSDKIHEALKRLIERRYIVPASHASAGAAAAYWASLGLPPETAEQNLQNCRVRIQSIDVQGAAELGAALSKLGVRVVKRSADLTVTLVNDYLEAAPGRIEPAAFVGSHALAARSALRHFSAGGTGVQPGQERLLDLPCRSHETQPGGQGVSRPQTGAPRRGFAARRATRSDRAPSSLRRSRSRRRSPPTFAPSCAITSSASICWARPSRSITWRPVRNVRPAAARSCATRAARRRRSSLAPAPSWS